MSRRIVSITPALAGQCLAVILADLFAVEALLGSHRRSDHRAIAVALVSVVEQFCRLTVADMLGRGRGTLPEYVEIRLASIGSAARLSKEALASFTHNFQNIEAIEKMLREYGLGDVFRDNPGLRDALIALFAARNDNVHTAVPVAFDVRAAYEAVLQLVFGIASHIPELEAEMRIVQGNVFKWMGMLQRSRDGYELSEPLCRALVRKHPESAQAHARLGLALFGLARYEEALTSYDRAVSLEPGRAVTHLARALPLANLGRSEEALVSCGTAAELDPSLPDAHLSKANILAGMGRGTEALAACDRAIEMDGSLQRAHLLRGSILSGMGRSAEALAAYDRSIVLDVYDGNARLRRADLLAGMSRSVEALGAYDVAAELDPQNADVYSRKASLLRILGRHDEALCNYNRAIGAKPDHTDALVGKAGILALLGRDGEPGDRDRPARP